VAQLLLYAVATGGALVIGAALGCFRTPPKRLTAGMLAFASGALVVAVAFELFEPAHRHAGLARASAALLVGAAAFIAVDLLIQRRAGAEAGGLALVAAVTLDGVPENLALGVGLAESGSYALLASIVVSNLPEAFGGAAQMRESGASSAQVLSIGG
jgi:zinc transporter, ZIP family